MSFFALGAAIHPPRVCPLLEALQSHALLSPGFSSDAMQPKAVVNLKQTLVDNSDSEDSFSTKVQKAYEKAKPKTECKPKHKPTPKLKLKTKDKKENRFRKERRDFLILSLH